MTFWSKIAFVVYLFILSGGVALLVSCPTNTRR